MVTKASDGHCGLRVDATSLPPKLAEALATGRHRRAVQKTVRAGYQRVRLDEFKMLVEHDLGPLLTPYVIWPALADAREVSLTLRIPTVGDLEVAYIRQRGTWSRGGHQALGDSRPCVWGVPGVGYYADLEDALAVAEEEAQKQNDTPTHLSLPVVHSLPQELTERLMGVIREVVAYESSNRALRSA